MCGIVGYTGPREAGPILIEGLKRLEYRGYDSAGIALVDDAGDLFVEKRAGKLVNLQTAIADRTPHAAIGLAHTRWATHGRPNDLNAHPHQDCTGEITVIHNGIIENFRELRDGLEARGHTPHLGDGHGGDRPSRRGGLPRRPGRRRARRPAPARWRLRHRGHAPCRGRSAGRRTQGRPARGRPWPTARASWPPTWPRSWPTPTRSSSSRTATSPTSARWGVTITDVHGATLERPVDDDRLVARERPRRAATSTSCSRRSTSNPSPSASRSPGESTRHGRIHVEELDRPGADCSGRATTGSS